MEVRYIDDFIAKCTQNLVFKLGSLQQTLGVANKMLITLHFDDSVVVRQVNVHCQAVFGSEVFQNELFSGLD